MSLAEYIIDLIIFNSEECIAVMNRSYSRLITCLLVVVMVLAMGFGALAAEKQPLIHYTFDDGSGTNVTDASGNEKHGMVEGSVAWSTEGRLGGAIVLEGEDGFVRLPDNIMKQMDAMTVAVWVKLNSNPLWSRVFDFAGSKGFMYLTLNAGDPAGNTRFSIYAGDPTKEPVLSAPADIFELNKWIHVAVTASETEYCFYVNGEKKAALPVTHLPKDIGSDVLMSNYLGKSQFEDPFLDGMLDEFYLYTVALTEEEVAALYNIK